MLPYERQALLLERFQSGHVMSAEDIMNHFGVSIATARRDLKRLEDQHHVKKVYGGAVLIDQNEDAPLRDRMILHSEQKAAIGRAAADLVNDGDFILLDSGTTNRQVAIALKKKRGLTVVTNSLLAADELINSDVSLIVLGGQLRKEELSLVGPSVVDMLDNYQASKCFISVSGLSLSYGMSDFLADEVAVKKKFLQRSCQIYLTADSSKFDYVAPRHVCGLTDADAIITDGDLPQETADKYRAAGCRLILAE
ncbi:DeoR/GlpR family DNA-binding transcription regulator [Oscillibacter sp.]|uniref:DeoR/GlpR family DNA-binding transcription regulator n=1 Tax=Oscillibacter sp. TaxID=1945593 RepID=UPI002D7F814D|nr:DeoR/GlpR family DNA-binding transcription regulator [Oscillibacter sp.]